MIWPDGISPSSTGAPAPARILPDSHPVAACFVAQLFMLPLLGRLMGRKQENYTVTAELTVSLGANHGREQINSHDGR